MQTRTTRGARMKITQRSTALTPTIGVGATEAAAPAAAPAAGTVAEAAPLQAGTLAPAQEALAAMPDIDSARVAAVRDALARGEIRFDARRLAGLIERFHGGRG